MGALRPLKRVKQASSLFFTGLLVRKEQARLVLRSALVEEDGCSTLRRSHGRISDFVHLRKTP